jgi:hypothetical protein
MLRLFGVKPSSSSVDHAAEGRYTSGMEPLAQARTVEVNVSLDRRRDQEDVLRDLKSVGLHVEQVLGRLHVVSGTVQEDQLPAIARVDGVKAVERDRPVFTG